MKTFRLLLPGLAVGLAVANVAHAKAPVERYSVNATAGTVLDTATKLTWQRAVSEDIFDWKSAKEYCAKLALDGTAPWKAPNIRQLESLVDLSETGPSIDKAAFPGTYVARYWSSSPFTKDPTVAFAVDFSDGSIALMATATPTYRVRCVR